MKITKKILALTLMAILMISGVWQMVYAENDITSANIIQTVTISIPEVPGLEISFNSVYDQYRKMQYIVTDKEYFFYLDELNPTFSLNKDAPNQYGADIQKDEPYTIAIENGFGMAEILAAPDGILVSWEADVNYDDYFRIVFMVKGDPVNDIYYESYQKGGIFPLSELMVGVMEEQPTETPVQLVATPTASTVLVNGENVSFDAYLIEGNNYFKLRDLAYILNGTEKQFEVGWDGAANAISLTSGKSYTAVGGEMTGKGGGAKTPTPTNSKIIKDGAEVQFTAYLIDGNNYFKLRDIGAAFDFGVEWDGANNAIVIDTSKGYTVE